jgi:hypothetical protein
VGFGIDRRARSRKPRGGLRALFGKAPDARELGDRLARLARRMFKDAVLDATPRRLTLALHPFAPPVQVVVLPDGDLEIRAETASVGPGYHAEVLARVERLFDELELAWDGDAGDPERAITTWLADELREGATRIGMPADRSFKLPPELVIQTAMGPRDAAWRDSVLADPMRGADAFAWWRRGRGQAARSRALLAMWHEVPWREPLDADERALCERVAADLAAAYRADPTLELPWAEWAELLDHAALDDELATTVRDRAAGRSPVIGYRRYAMDVEVAGGWTLELGGAFVTHWEEEDARWWATDGERVLEVTSFTAPDDTDSARLLAVAPEHHPVVERLVDGARCGRAEAHDEDGVHIVHGLMAHAPHVAILTLKGGEADHAWALATWRSLRQTA